MWLNRFTRFHAFCTFLLIIAGGLVTSTDSGLAVPDWPKSYGMWMPPMVGGVFYEHGHRMIASFVGFLTIILAVWLWRQEPRKWVRNLGFLALFAVILQGVLGGITVLFFLPTPISVMHATLAQTFFCLSVSIVIFTSSWWKETKPSIVGEGNSSRIFLAATVAVYLQLILGAWVRHSGAALAIPTFPLAFGRFVPSFTTPEIAIQFAHRVWALIVLLLVCSAFSVVMRKFRNIREFRNPAILLLVLTVIQILLGGYTVLTGTAIPVATAHVAVGALILATCVTLTIRSYRLIRHSEKRVPEASIQVAAGRTA
jgi:cytochrome c oxidase assembly protein subunit 15